MKHSDTVAPILQTGALRFTRAKAAGDSMANNSQAGMEKATVTCISWKHVTSTRLQDLIFPGEERVLEQLREPSIVTVSSCQTALEHIDSTMSQLTSKSDQW